MPHGPQTQRGVIRVVIVAPRSGDPAPGRPVVVAPGGEPLANRPSPLSPASPPMAVETTTALARLGDPVEILRADDALELAARLREPDVDLVLIDRRPPHDQAELLAAIPPEGPPSVVVVSGSADEEALLAFRQGASDCVQVGPDFERVLPVVLLEQVRRGRSDRQRRASERHIRWLEDLYAAIVSEMPAALVVIDDQGRMVATNPEFERLFPPVLPVRSFQDGESPSVGEWLGDRLPSELVEAVERREPASQEGSADDPGGSVELVRVEGAPSGSRAFEIRRRRLDEVGGMLLLISDVTRSEWLGQRLDSLRRDQREIIENINSALLVVDAGGEIRFANSAAEAILGGEGEAIVGRRIGDWFDAPEIRNTARVPSPIEDCLATGARSRGTETLLRKGDGQWIPVGISCSPRIDAAGSLRGVVAVFQDLSEIKQLELQVRQAEKMASIGQLAAGVAHEMNNPMGFIQANLHQMTEYLADLNRVFEGVDRLQAAVAEGDPETIRSASEDLTAVAQEVDLDYVRHDFEQALLESGEGAERIRYIVKDLRDFSRPDLPARSAADVNQAVESTANIVWTMTKHSIELEKDLSVLPEIEAYPMQLKQVFMNLLVNACQAVEAREDDARGWVRIETEVDGPEVVVRIRDSGVGIPREDIPRIFEPYFTTKPVGSGTGLGLSTSFGIVERHGGRILVESGQGEGTTFEVRLPIREPGDRDPAADERELHG